MSNANRINRSLPEPMARAWFESIILWYIAARQGLDHVPTLADCAPETFWQLANELGLSRAEFHEWNSLVIDQHAPTAQ